MTAQDLQLAPPQTPNSRVFATKETTVSFDFRLEGAEIHFTTDGSEPTTQSSIYSNPLKTKGLETLKAKAFKSGFLPSETTTVQLLPLFSSQFDSIALSPAPKKYLGDGWKTLCDGKLGDGNFHQKWLGFESKEIELQLFFTQKKPISQVSVGLLRQQGAWIFLPAAIEIYDEKGRRLAGQTLPQEANELPTAQEIIPLNLPKRRYKFLKIKLIALPTLPTWHPGKGNNGWMFLDEIMAR